jgi:signal transduction histidine kinase
MIVPGTPYNEMERLQALHKLKILDTAAEESFDNLVELAATICEAPYAIITMVDEDRQWFKAKYGTDICGSPRDIAYCSHAILNPGEILLVEDASKDERFAGNQLGFEQGERIKFYAGVPLMDEDGHALGTLCVLDHKSHKLSKERQESLKKLARQVEALLALRERNTELKRTRIELKDHNKILKDFAGMVSHNLKMPIANMVLTADILKKRLEVDLENTDIDHLTYLKNSGLRLSDFITDLLNFYDTEKVVKGKREELDLHEFLEEIIDLLNITQDVEINLPEDNCTFIANRFAVTEVFTNLLTNSIKFSDKERVEIFINCAENSTHTIFNVRDNGTGIPPGMEDEIFDLFSTRDYDNRYGKNGNGIGLSTARKIVEMLGGEISLDQVEGDGASFTFSIKK